MLVIIDQVINTLFQATPFSFVNVMIINNIIDCYEILLWGITSSKCLLECKNLLVWDLSYLKWEREREIKFIGLFENRGHRGPYSPYKPFNHNLYIGIIIFPHIDNPQYTGYDLPKKKPNKIINAKKVRAPLIWQIIGEKDFGSVYMWI